MKAGLLGRILIEIPGNNCHTIGLEFFFVTEILFECFSVSSIYDTLFEQKKVREFLVSLSLNCPLQRGLSLVVSIG